MGLGATGWTAWRYRSDLVGFSERFRANLPKPDSSPASPPRPVILPHEKDYAEFLGNLDLRYIAPHEILAPHRRELNGIANVLPPRQYWKRMIPTLQVADELRQRLGCKLRYITSAFRSPEYNAQCPGASPKSYHTKNLALDLVYDCPPPDAIAEAKKMRAEGIFRGGLGLYQTFIHIDTRGRNSDWG